MRIHRVVTTMSAIAATFLVALVPAAHAVGPIAQVIVGGSSSPAAHVVSFAVPAQQPLAFTVGTFFGPLYMPCSNASFVGGVNRGNASTTPSPLAPNPAFQLSFNFGCIGFLGRAA